MRTELETIAYIEKYILNTLTNTELKAFEERMATDSDFKSDVALQQQLIQGLERISLHQSIQNAHKTYQFQKLIKLIGIIVIPILLAFLSWYFINASTETAQGTEAIPTKVEQQIQTSKTEKITIEKDIVKETIKQPVVTTKKETAIYVDNTTMSSLDKIPSAVFNILPEKDTIIATESGMVLFIPENTFIDENQRIVNGNIQLEVKEATDSYTIMTAGLETLHNGKPLETGGMFFIEAKQNGQKLQIHLDKEIIADIPTQDYKEGMQLFDGEVSANGTINWVNPKPLSKSLIPEDIFSLNFYPPNYLETLAEKGYDTTNKKFTDSLYYSFSTNSNTEKKNVGGIIYDALRSNPAPVDTIRSDRLIVSKDSVRSKDTETEVLLGLDPLKVKTIWNERYQNTFIATKAFEERLRVIHQNCEAANRIFDVYVKNLDRDLYEVDQMLFTRYKNTSLRKQFETFAAQKLTNVANVNSEISKLNEYYLKQQKVYRLALEETQRKMDSLMSVDKKYQAFSKQQLQDYYANELATTTDKVAKNLAVSLPRRFNRVSNRSQTVFNQTNTVSNEVATNVISVAKIIKQEKRKRVYRAPIRRTGWKNIDRIIDEQVISSVQNRQTTTIQNNKKSVTITYSDYEVSIENKERFDRLFVYLVPTTFNSFVRLKAENNRFYYKLNDLLRYRIHCIAYVNDIPFYVEKTVRDTSDNLQLDQITETILREKLASLHHKNSSLETEILYQSTRKTNEKVLRKHREVVKLKKKIENVVFPCQQTETLRTLTNKIFQAETSAVENVDVLEENITEIPFELVENVPLYPGCESLETQTERKKCMSDEIQKIVNRKTNTDILSKYKKTSGTHRILTTFVIDSSGVVTNVRVRTNHPEIETEIKRVLALIPKMIPASQEGKTVSVKYMLPIIIRIDE